jgi:hypothetical protein
MCRQVQQGRRPSSRAVPTTRRRGAAGGRGGTGAPEIAQPHRGERAGRAQVGHVLDEHHLRLLGHLLAALHQQRHATRSGCAARLRAQRRRHRRAGTQGLLHRVQLSDGSGRAAQAEARPARAAPAFGSDFG